MAYCASICKHPTERSVLFCGTAEVKFQRLYHPDVKRWLFVNRSDIGLEPTQSPASGHLSGDILAKGKECRSSPCPWVRGTLVCFSDLSHTVQACRGTERWVSAWVPGNFPLELCFAARAYAIRCQGLILLPTLPASYKLLCPEG